MKCVFTSPEQYLRTRFFLAYTANVILLVDERLKLLQFNLFEHFLRYISSLEHEIQNLLSVLISQLVEIVLV